ncbi:hypothetical protein RvY_00069 [Ramazzottius varieornatus]|uniref:RIB43A-like with coiled-coils protein 2 n=1 Tax=Ramazzottius varieornatus TaxID=947166 RepID=A0A1D1UBD0_RAMVA|nr:hypothetical protein RvY_00069 [Ramazzottius varieornatus]
MSYFTKLPIDTALHDRLTRKRQTLEERGRKIFDADASKQAYHVEDLQRQVHVRKAQEMAEKMRDLTFDQATCRQAIAHQLIDAQQKEVKKALAHEVDGYRRYFQRKEDSSTYDLNDPNASKSFLPVGASGDYSIYGPSSILTFDSDKIRQPEDIKNSINKQRDDLQRQMWEEAAKKDFERHLDNIAHKESMAKEAKMRGREDATKDLKHAMNKAVSHYNESLAVNQEEGKRRLRELENQDKKVHINNTMNSDLLNEHPTNPRDRKGISPEEKKKIYEMWERQKHDREIAKNQERAEGYTWDNYFRSMGVEYEAQMEKLKAERALLRAGMDEANRKQVLEDQEREEIAKAVYGRANPTEEFFDQFQRDPR